MLALNFAPRLAVTSVASFESAGPSVIKSIRQRDFVNTWLRLFAVHSTLPAIGDFSPNRMDDEAPDLAYFDVIDRNGEKRYRTASAGARLVDSFGFLAKQRDLQDTLSPNIWRYSGPIYDTCVARQLPVYSEFSVLDTAGGEVMYERLLLPFGDPAGVKQIITSLKSISIEGRFINKDLMRGEDHDPKYTLRAVIDQIQANRPPSSSAKDDIVES